MFFYIWLTCFNSLILLFNYPVETIFVILLILLISRIFLKKETACYECLNLDLDLTVELKKKLIKCDFIPSVISIVLYGKIENALNKTSWFANDDECVKKELKLTESNITNSTLKITNVNVFKMDLLPFISVGLTITTLVWYFLSKIGEMNELKRFSIVAMLGCLVFIAVGFSQYYTKYLFIKSELNKLELYQMKKTCLELRLKK